MAIILDGTKLSNKINKKTKNEIESLGISPNLVAVQVGENPESSLYISHKSKKSVEVGIVLSHLKFDEAIDTKTLIKEINKLNKDSSVDGIMIQLPLPNHIDTKLICQSISPQKDVDGFHPLNKGLLDINKADLIPPTAQGVIELLNEYNIPLAGKTVAIIGLGEIAGKPLAKIFVNNDATVLMCNKKTINIFKFTKEADIVVVAVGHKYLLDETQIKKGSIVINIGITKDEEGIHGDVVFESMLKKASYITPIIGGTGPMTVSLLLRNTLICRKLK
ncbi:MAG: bifunctional 5,10-methylenetetrahydrofolate dehydrogenase/5,10-methenyltetrahydrofolate cyclohydrolase [Mycoplasmataceae bacterium]|nr:bifunctional 5,10-methylenetetrahydrofolate dehydrogenase/5,10-methenyltetrahydrofolate cyclohydrolase [Mycoplasmataceae bacterium]